MKIAATRIKRTLLRALILLFPYQALPELPSVNGSEAWLPVIKSGDDYFAAKLNLVDIENLIFQIDNATLWKLSENIDPSSLDPVYSPSGLVVPDIKVGDSHYSLLLDEVDSENMEFQINPDTITEIPSIESRIETAFNTSISAQIIQADCISCHVTGGIAEDSSLVFVSSSHEEHEATNLNAITDYIAAPDVSKHSILVNMADANHVPASEVTGTEHLKAALSNFLELATADQCKDGCQYQLQNGLSESDRKMVEAILAAAPAQHATEARFKKIPGSEIDVLVTCEEFPEFGKNIGCYKSHNAFIDWTGGAWNWKDWEFTQPAGGGHYDYGGNEVYRAKLLTSESILTVSWDRPIDPQPLTISSGTGNDVSNAENNCGAPRSGPVASHTYAAPLYIEANDEYWHATTGGWPSVSFCRQYADSRLPGMGLWTHANDKWVKRHRFLDLPTKYTMACYHRNANHIYIWTGGSASYYEVNASDWTWDGGKTGGYMSNAGYFDSSMDQLRDICYFYRKGLGIRGYRYDHQGNQLENVFRSVSTILKSPSLSVEHSTGNVVLVGTQGFAMHIDVQSGEELDISATEGEVIPGEATASYLYGKFDMIEKIPCVGIGISDAREGVWLMTLPSNVCSLGGSIPTTKESDSSAVSATKSALESTENLSEQAKPFLERCRQPNVVFCDPLSTHGPYTVKSGLLSVASNPDGSQGIYDKSWWKLWRGTQDFGNPGEATADYDPQLDALRLVKTDARASSGLFTTNFSPDNSQIFGPGESFTVSFQVRYNCDYVYMDCDPDSADYKTDRRPFPVGSSTQGSKIAIIAEGDTEVTKGTQGACDVIQLVPFQSHGAIQAFHDCGKYSGISSSTGKTIGGSKQIEFQPGGEFSCLRFPDNRNRVGMSWAEDGIGPHCARIESDTWMTIEIRVTVAEWDTPDTNFQLWFSQGENEELKKVIDRNITLRLNNSSGYGKIWFQMHSTGASTEVGEPTKIVWYRNLIVAKSSD